jgi:hypothetical protein
VVRPLHGGLPFIKVSRAGPRWSGPCTGACRHARAGLGFPALLRPGWESGSPLVGGENSLELRGRPRPNIFSRLEALRRSLAVLGAIDLPAKAALRASRASQAASASASAIWTFGMDAPELAGEIIQRGGRAGAGGGFDELVS